MATRWAKTQQALKERDMVRIHIDLPREVRQQLRLAAVQDGKKLIEVYTEAIIDYLRDRKIQRASDPKRSNDLKLDLTGLEDL